MPLFMCSKCKCVENTALGEYWQESVRASTEKREPQPKCSECARGTWHGQFDKEPATGWFLCSDGFLYSKAELASEAKRFKRQKISVVREIA